MKKRETLDELTKLKLKIPAFPYGRTKTITMKTSKKTRREKSEIHVKISVRFLRYIAQVFPAVAAPAAAVVALA